MARPVHQPLCVLSRISAKQVLLLVEDAPFATVGDGRADEKQQKQQLLALRSDRDQISVYLRDVDTAQRAYDAITWYYPQHGDHFDPREYINACTGRYVEH